MSNRLGIISTQHNFTFSIMLEWAPGPNAVYEWTQEWIQTLNKEEEGQAPTFRVEPPDAAQKRNDNSNTGGKSILRNGYKKKRSVSWSKTIQVETFEKIDSRDDTQESESESDESQYEELDISHAKSMDSDAPESRVFDEVDNDRDELEDVLAQISTDEEDIADDVVGDITDNRDNKHSTQHETVVPHTTTEESEDVFAHIEASFSGEENAPFRISTDTSGDDVFDLVAANSTISETTLESGKAEAAAPDDNESDQNPSNREEVKLSSVFTPVILPDNFRLENRLGIDENGSFCTLSEDDRSLISNMDDTVCLVARRAASDDESIVSLRKRPKEYDETKQREIDGVLGHLGLNLPLPSMKDLWLALGVNEFSGIEVVQQDKMETRAEGGKDVPQTGSFSEAVSEESFPDKYSTEDDESDVLSDMATLSRDVSVCMSQDELGSLWESKNSVTSSKKKSRFGRKLSGRFSFSRKKGSRNDGVPSSIETSRKRRGLFKKRRKRSKTKEPQLLIC